MSGLSRKVLHQPIYLWAHSSTCGNMYEMDEINVKPISRSEMPVPRLNNFQMQQLMNKLGSSSQISVMPNQQLTIEPSNREPNDASVTKINVSPIQSVLCTHPTHRSDRRYSKPRSSSTNELPTKMCCQSDKSRSLPFSLTTDVGLDLKGQRSQYFVQRKFDAAYVKHSTKHSTILEEEKVLKYSNYLADVKSDNQDWCKESLISDNSSNADSKASNANNNSDYHNSISYHNYAGCTEKDLMRSVRQLYALGLTEPSLVIKRPVLDSLLTVLDQHPEMYMQHIAARYIFLILLTLDSNKLAVKALTRLCEITTRKEYKSDIQQYLVALLLNVIRVSILYYAILSSNQQKANNILKLLNV